MFNLFKKKSAKFTGPLGNIRKAEAERDTATPTYYPQRKEGLDSLSANPATPATNSLIASHQAPDIADVAEDERVDRPANFVAVDPKVLTPAQALPLPSTLSETMNLLPEEVIIKRIWARKGVNKWLVKFHNSGTEYYDVTLEGALTQMFRNQKIAALRFAANRRAVGSDD